MHKKLQKYINQYETLKEYAVDIIQPDGGMILMINLGEDCQFILDDEMYSLESHGMVLINALEVPFHLNEYEKLILVRFKGAGASFFYPELMESFMFDPMKPIFLKESLANFNVLEEYLLALYTPSKLAFNIMNIVDYLDETGSDYCIDEVMRLANCPRKVLDKAFRLNAGIPFKTYAGLKRA